MGDSFGGLLGRIFRAHGVFVTTPNAAYIPSDLLLGVRDIRQRADAYFGQDDPALHPQYFDNRVSHLCCIPQQSLRITDNHAFWYTPIESTDFELETSGGISQDVGRLRSSCREDLRIAATTLLELCDNDLQLQHNDALRKDRTTLTLRNNLRYFLRRLNLLASFRETLALYRHAARIALELQARIIWLTLVRWRYYHLQVPGKPDGTLAGFDDDPSKITITRCVGALTTDLAVAENLYRVCFLFGLSRIST